MMNKREIEIKLKSLISDAIPVLKRNNDSKNLMQGIFSSSRGNNLIIAMDYQEKEKIDAPAKYVFSFKEIRKKYSQGYIENLLLDCMANLFNNENGLDEIVKSMVYELVTSKEREYLVISELDNIELIDDQEYEFIDSTIKMLKEADIPFDVKTIRLPGMDILNKPCIITKVSACEKRRVKEIALHSFLVSLNLLRLFIPSYKPGLKGSLYSNIQSFIVHDTEDKSVSVDMERIGDSIVKKSKLSSELYSQFLESGIGDLKRDTEISKVVKECLYWYGLGLDETYPAAALIDFVTVLESTLKKKSETTELRRTVSERGAVLLNDTFTDRKKAFRQLRDIYDLRSKVVHTGALIDNKDLAFMAGGYARAVLLTLIEKSSAFNGRFEEFINYIDDIKLGKDLNA